MRTSLDIAVVGAGTVGRVHARVVAEHPETNLAAVVDIDEETARSVGDHNGADGSFTELERSIESTAVDVVIVATPETAHLAPTERALAADCDVLLEKPIAATVADANRIGHLVDAADAELMLGFTLRSDRRYSELRRRIERGEFGRILAIQAARIANRYIYRRASDWAEPMTYLASHDIDAMRWFVEAPITDVTAVASSPLDGGTQPAVVHATLRFANGTIGVLETNWARTDSYPAHRTDEIRLTGTEGHARMVLDAESSDATISVERSHGEQEHEQGRPEIPAHSNLPTAELHGKRVDQYRWQLEYFLDVVRGESPPLATWRDGLRALEVATALAESYETDRTVTVPADSSARDGRQHDVNHNE